MLVELRTTGSELAPFCTKARAGSGDGGIGVGATGRVDSFSIDICVSRPDIQFRDTAFPRSRLLLSQEDTERASSTRALATLSPMRVRVFELEGSRWGRSLV